MAPSSIAHHGNEDHIHSSMMAWRVHEFGPPDVMRFERILRPHPSPGEVLVKVKAAGVGPWDGWIRAGKSALPQPLPLTLGSDLSGEVVAVESGDLRVGDQVYGVTNPQFVGAYAEYLRSAFLSIIEITIPHDCATLLLLWLALSYCRTAIGACGDNGCEWEATPRPIPDHASHSLNPGPGQLLVGYWYCGSFG
jgi:Alcohol dehydrogenase GroES-like domain